MPDGSFGSYSDDDFVKPGGRKWLKRSLYIVLALAVIGGGLYGGYRWTQTQFYVGAKNDNVALYRGISQDLAWVSLSKVEDDHPEIELKYLPPYQRKQVEATIAEGSLADAREKVTELSTQATACKKDAQRRAAEKNALSDEGQAGEYGHGRHQDVLDVRRHQDQADFSDSHSWSQPLGGREEAGPAVR